MLNLDQYRTSSDYREILRILQKSSTLQSNMLWQSFDNQKNVVPVHHFEIDFVSREVVLLFDSTKNKVNINKPLYVKLAYRETVFKVTEFRLTLNTLSFSFPDEVKTLELRSIPRHIFKTQIEKHVAIRTALSAVKETASELHFRSLDISPTGVGLIVSEHNRSFLKNNRILWVTRLQDMVLPRPILAEVVYINNDSEVKQGRKQRELKVGLKLSDNFPEEYYNRFIL